MCFPPSTFCFLIMLSLHCQIIHSLYNILFPIQFSSVQLLSCVRLFATPWIAACQAFLSFITSWCLLKLMSIESVMPSNHLILCCPLCLLPSIFPSIRVFSSELALGSLRDDPVPIYFVGIESRSWSHLCVGSGWGFLTSPPHCHHRCSHRDASDSSGSRQCPDDARTLDVCSCPVTCREIIVWQVT